MIGKDYLFNYVCFRAELCLLCALALRSDVLFVTFYASRTYSLSHVLQHSVISGRPTKAHGVSSSLRRGFRTLRQNTKDAVHGYP